MQFNRQTLLSQIIRHNWSEQKKSGFYEKKEEFGYWEVSDENYRKATFPYMTEMKTKLPESCELSYWLTDLLRKEIRTINLDSSISLFQFPEQTIKFDWDTADSEQWLTYWIFVNISKQ